MMSDHESTTTISVWAKAIAIVGIPGVIALYLVWAGASTLPSMQRDVTLNRQEVQRNRELIEDMKKQMDEIMRELQRLCVAAARNTEDRGACFDRK